MSGKLLMFATRFLKSLIYDIAETFCFPDQTIAEIYKKISNRASSNLSHTNYTDSAALQFPFISDPNRDLPEGKFRDIIFEVITATKIYRRFDSSHELWNVLDLEKKAENKARLLRD